MKQRILSCFWLLAFYCCTLSVLAQNKVHVNQVGWDRQSPKIAMVQTNNRQADTVSFFIQSEASRKTVFRGRLDKSMQVEEWTPGLFYYQADLSAVRQPGARVRS